MFQVKTRIIFGENTIERVREFETGKCLIICGRHLQRENTLETIKKNLSEKPTIYDRIKPEPSVDDVREYWEEIRGEDFNPIIAIGGGSVLDVSKILAALMTNKEDVEEFIGVGKIKRDMKKLIAIPTTSGSGSEVTKYAVVKHNGVKSTVVSEKIYPSVAIVDPLLTVTMPRELTAYTAMDALTHNIEAFISKQSDAFTELIAMEGIRLCLGNIEKAYRDGKDLNARKNLALASVLGGIAITNANAGIVHALSHALGGMYPVGHGRANAIFLPHAVEYNYTEKIRKAERALGVSLPKHLRELNERLGIGRLGEITDKCRKIAEKAYENKRLMDVNPKKITVEDLKGIVEDSM